jgi:ABC-type nitrate/sulfonate/bicarbonate transport system substrate-binding protein
MNKKYTYIMLVVVVLAAVASLKFVSRRPAAGPVEVRILNSSTPTDREIVEVLTGTDVFKQEGINLKLIPASAASGPRFQGLLSGALDVEGGAWIGWINIRSRGGKIRAVHSGGIQTSEKPAGIMVLENSGIHSVKDLVGKSIAINTLGLTAEYTIKELLKKNGVPPEQVQFVAVPTENQEQVLRTKQVDAAADTACYSTWIDMAIERGGVRILPDTSNYSDRGENASTGSGFTEEFIDKHPDVVRGYVSASEKVRRLVSDEFKKDPERVRAAYAQVAERKGGNPKLAKYYRPEYSDKYQFITDGDIQWWIDLLVAEGKLKAGQVKAADVYTNEFNPYYKK